MPDMVTHYLFGKDALDNMDEYHQNIIKVNRKYFDLGCNGPDPFFYYHVLPYQSKEDKPYIRNMGSLLHYHDLNKMFTNMLCYLREHYSKELHSYILGFMMHYYCDRHCHPYIYYFAGLEEVKEIYGYYHKQIEVQIDQMLLELFEGKTLKTFKIHQIIKHTDQNIEVIYPLIQYILKQTYDLDLEFNKYKECWDDFYLIEKLAGSSSPIKKKLVEKYEQLTNQLPFFSTAIYAPDYKEYDVLNLKRQTWCDPCFEDITFNKTFIDCYLEGVKDVENMIQAIDKYLIDGNQHYLSLINNCGFDTNHEEGIKQHYFKCLYEK